MKGLASAPGPARPASAVTLEGRYIRLEPLSAKQHAKALYLQLCGQGTDELWRWMAVGPFADEVAFTAYIRQIAAQADTVFFALVVPESGAVLGYLSLMRADVAHGVIEIGSIMFGAAVQRTRMASEAVYLLARLVFDELGYRRLEWKCNTLNAPSRRAALRFGFVFEGIFRQHMIVKGQNRDTAWFAMLDGGWPARRAAFEAWLAPGNFDRHGGQIKKLQQES
ncbi:MAG: GNAT family N-acetyltransferase [Hyphomicrobiales bacterium]|nr:GNAT family N-acetyltransferase [Hyphomicrobiales bacterium]